MNEMMTRTLNDMMVMRLTATMMVLLLMMNLLLLMVILLSMTMFLVLFLVLQEDGFELDPFGDLDTQSERRLGLLVRQKYVVAIVTGHSFVDPSFKS